MVLSTEDMILSQQYINVSTTPSFEQVCNLSQLEMLNQLEKLPVKLFILIASVAALLVLYNSVLPAIKWKYRDALDAGALQLAVALSLFATVLCASLVFTVTKRTWYFIEGGLLVLVLVAVGYRFYMWRKGVPYE